MHLIVYLRGRSKYTIICICNRTGRGLRQKWAGLEPEVGGAQTASDKLYKLVRINCGISTFVSATPPANTLICICCIVGNVSASFGKPAH